MDDLMKRYERGEITADEYIDTVAKRKKQAAETESPHDFSHSGLGIGGAGQHDLVAETAELVARGEMHVVERERKGPMPHGQLWEPCPRCSDEPVCLDCGLCKRHCTC